MAFKLYDSYGYLVGNIVDVRVDVYGTKVTLDTGRKLQFGRHSIFFDNDHDGHISECGFYHIPMVDNCRYITQARAMLNTAHAKGAAAMNAAVIKDAIFAPPATIVYWSDGTKTVVKCSEKDIFDPEKGLAMAIAKRCGGNKGSYYKEIQHWVEKSGKKYPGKPAAGKAVDLDVLKKYSSEANKDFEKFLSAAKSNDQSGALLHLTALVADLKILENEINK